MNIKETAEIAYETAKAKGFWEEGPDNNVGTRLMLTTSELGEAMEAHRCGKFADMEKLEYMLKTGGEIPDYSAGVFCPAFESCIKDTFEDELADAMIRLMNMAHGMGIDIEKHIELKMRYNDTRPYKHGKKY